MDCKNIISFDWSIRVEENARFLAEQSYYNEVEILENEIKENEEMLKDIIIDSITYNKIKRKIEELRKELEELEAKKNEIIEDYSNWDWDFANELTIQDWEIFKNELEKFINDGSLWLVNGSVGTWRGRLNYDLQFIGTFENFLNKATDGGIEVELFDCGSYKKIEVRISHHDGTNYYELVDNLKEYLKEIEFFYELDNEIIAWIISEFVKYREDVFVDKLLKLIKKNELIKILENYYNDCDYCNKKQNKKELFENLFSWAEEEFIYFLIRDYSKKEDFVDLMLKFDEDTFFDYVESELN